MFSITEIIKPQVDSKFNHRCVEAMHLLAENQPMDHPLGIIITNALEKLGKPQSWLAEKIGVSDNAVSKWRKTGKIARHNVPKLSDAIGVSSAELLRAADPLVIYEDGMLASPDLKSDMPEGSYIVDRTKIAHVPVVGKGMGGLPDRIFTDEGRPANGHDEYAEIYSADPGAFVVRVTENSMFPKYAHGQYALVEPNTIPEIEDDVLIKINDGRVMIKRLVSMRGGIVLASYNDHQTHAFDPADIIWMYYIAYPVPSRKIKSRI